MDERQRDTMLANFAISGGSEVAIAMGQVLAEREAAQAAADAGAEAVGAMAAKVSAVLEENGRLRAVVDAVRKIIYYDEQGERVIAEGYVVAAKIALEQLDGSEVTDG